MTIEKIPAARAHKALAKLAAKLGLHIAQPGACDCGELGPDRVGIVGSLRRGASHVRDIDLLAPIPETGQDDLIHQRVAELFGDQKAAEKNPLYATVAAPGSEWGRVLSGLSPGFKKLTLELQLRGDTHNPDPTWSTPYALKIEIHRYTPGPKGNRGWIEMIRTGPGGGPEEVGFGEMMLIRWKQRTPGGRSQDGWPVFDNGDRHPVPDEEAAFRAVGLRWIAPEHRTLALAKTLAGARRTA